MAVKIVMTCAVCDREIERSEAWNLRLIRYGDDDDFYYEDKDDWDLCSPCAHKTFQLISVTTQNEDKERERWLASMSLS